MPALDILPPEQAGQEFALAWHPGPGQLDLLLAEDPGRRKDHVRCVSSPKWVGETNQLGFALEGNCGIANAVQMAQGREMQPQTLCTR